jgi:hypothetical protein
VWSRAQGIGEGLAARFRSIDWSSSGGDRRRVRGRVSHAVSGGGKIAAAFQNLFRSIDWNALGRAAGPGIAAADASARRDAHGPVVLDQELGSRARGRPHSSFGGSSAASPAGSG